MSWCRKAVILAAGRGTRLGTLAEEMPKCLLPVGGKALLDHHLDSLAAAGIQDVTVVVGFEGDRVVAHAAGRCRIVVNDRYETTNSIVSLHLAGAHLRGHAFVMQNGDVLYHPELIRRLLDAQRPNACLIDADRAHVEHEYHVALDGGWVAEYSREVSAGRSAGESAQLIKVGTADSAAFFDRLGAVIDAGGQRGFPLQAYDALIAGDGLWPVYAAGLPWWEIDTLEDYLRCQAAHDGSNGAAPPASLASFGMLRSFIAQPRIPHRYAWVPKAARIGWRHPIRTVQRSAALHRRRLTTDALDLQVNGDRILSIALREAERAGLAPMLLWGSLLGCIRDGGFIPGDRDIDLGIMQREAARLPTWRDAMMQRGFARRIENEYKLSLVHPSHPRLFVDIDIVRQTPDGWAITNADADPQRVFHYVFAPDVFGDARPVVFNRRHTVRLPANPEGFLSAVYGDWHTQRAKLHVLYGPLNVAVELRG